jgi:arylsulfatase A-like enzyme
MEPHEFAGTIAPYHWDAVPHWPDRPRPPDGAPNVVVVVLDDVGFAQLGCFGSDIATPHVDQLAERGLRYTNFHTTALCSPWVPAWDALPDRARTVYARYMEAFAGFLSHTDDHLGRLVDHLERTGELDSTLVIVVSDNGASSEGGPVGSLNDARTWNAVPQSVDEAWERLDEIGGPRIHNNYPWGWTVAGNTPFRRWKREVHEGGVADP